MARYDPATTQALKFIQHLDPDGWAHAEPTADDYRKFERDVIDHYGKSVYDIYMQPGGWGDRPEV